MPYWSVHETLGVDAHNAPLKMRTRRIHLSRAVAWSCVRRHPVAGAALGSTDVEGSDPPVRGPGAGAGPGVFAHAGPRPPGVAPSPWIPWREGNAMAVFAALVSAVGLRASIAAPGRGTSPAHVLGGKGGLGHSQPGRPCYIRSMQREPR